MRRNRIKLRLNEESYRQLIRYLAQNKKIIQNPKTNFHSTLRYSEEVPLFSNPHIVKHIFGYFPIKISPETYYFDIFGNGCLVLGYENETVRDLHQYLEKKVQLQVPEKLNEMERKILGEYSRQNQYKIYSDSRPHITLTEGFWGNLDELPSFKHELVFNSFRWEV